MRWSPEAESAVGKVPFFVRKRVKKRVEEEATRQGSPVVTIDHVNACKQRFLSNMEDEVKGYDVESCFGPTGCPNRIAAGDDLAQRIEELLAKKDIRRLLKERVNGPLKLHHDFRISVSDCPNACSRPQIADIGIIGACRPKITTGPCTRCGACVEVCPEGAIMLHEDEDGPIINTSKCLACGKCIPACASGTLAESRKGYRILVGGKLGRHPQLGHELPGIFTADRTVSIAERCVDFYLRFNQVGERFGVVLSRNGLDRLEKEIGLS
jgi:dissimilatory sulfite reductase (desulfoviridin) alpha/beta subunit